MKKYKALLLKVVDKVHLLTELPFYPLVLFYLKKNLTTREGRKMLYLKSGGFIPLRRLVFYTLDKIFVQETSNYTKPSYEGLGGYIMDLKYAIAHQYFNDKIFDSNYVYALKSIRSIVAEKSAKEMQSMSIIDFGCGAGVFTRLLKKTYPEVKRVIGLDIRHEIMGYNRELYKTIDWGIAEDFDKYLKKENPANTILVCNGVVNFMTLGEVEALLSKKIHYIVWFYYIASEDIKKEYSRQEKILSKNQTDIDYNVELLCKERGYDFTYSHFTKEVGYGSFVYGVSRYNP